MDATQLERVRSGLGFFAALDQSGGSTPSALAHYGIDASRYQSDEQMYDLVHEMRTRVMTSPAFDGARILGAILFEQTMDRAVREMPTGEYLWTVKQVVPFLKVDSGLAETASDVQLMKPIPMLDELLERANAHRMFGTKMRSVIKDANESGVNAIVAQQFEIAARISAAGLVPILEPEVSIDSPHKSAAEDLLHAAIARHLAALADDGAPIMLKLTLPSRPGRYAELAADPRILRVLALSGGYDRNEACHLLTGEPAMIASFSRALLEGLTASQPDEEFNARLESSVEQIFRASVDKTARS